MPVDSPETPREMPETRPAITADLVAELVAEQLPAWRHLPVTAVDRQGWDNRTFRLGDELAVRLPSATGYVPAVAKEDRWLPVLAPRLPVPIPVPLAVGRPSSRYPFPWSVRPWLPGEPLDAGVEVDGRLVAEDVGAFLRALRAVPADGGPLAGSHSFRRGCHPSVYDDDVGRALAQRSGRVDSVRCRTIWAEALGTSFAGPPVWFHGDVAPGNLLAAGRRLSAVIDFGTCGVGDPACDLVLAWTFLSPADRRVFRAAVELPDDAWRRARGWALWKALITLADPAADRAQVAVQERALAAVLADDVVGPVPR